MGRKNDRREDRDPTCRLRPGLARPWSPAVGPAQSGLRRDTAPLDGRFSRTAVTEWAVLAGFELPAAAAMFSVAAVASVAWERAWGFI